MPFNVFNFIILVLSFHGFILNSDLTDRINTKLDKQIALPWVEISALDNLDAGFAYIVFDNNSISPENNNAFFYVVTLKHPSGDGTYKKIIATSAFSNDIYINTKSNGTWIGWEKK